MIEDFQNWVQIHELQELFSDSRDGETIDKEMFRFVRSDYFDDTFAYDGELGAIYKSDGTMLRIWAPTAQTVEMLIFPDAQAVVASQTFKMTAKPKGDIRNIFARRSAWYHL